MGVEGLVPPPLLQSPPLWREETAVSILGQFYIHCENQGNEQVVKVLAKVVNIYSKFDECH